MRLQVLRLWEENAMHRQLASIDRLSMNSIEADLLQLVRETQAGAAPCSFAAKRVHEVIEHHASRLARRWSIPSVYKDSTDLAQEWFRTWIGKGISRYSHYRPLYPVAYVILFRLCAAHARKLRTVNSAGETRGIQGDCPLMNAHCRDLVERTRQAIERLPHKHKLAVRLRYYDGVGSTEAARLLGVSTGRLHGLTHEARRILLMHLSKSGVTAADL